MTREAGFPTADIDVRIFHDTKFKNLRRQLDQSDAIEHASLLYINLVIECWSHGERLTVEEAAQDWQQPRPECVVAMVAVGLLDKRHRIPIATWNGWYGPAVARRDKRKEAGSKGGRSTARARGNGRRSNAGSSAGSDASAMLDPAGRQAGLSIPSIQSTPSTPRAGGEPSKLADLLPRPAGYPATSRKDL